MYKNWMTFAIKLSCRQPLIPSYYGRGNISWLLF